MKDAQDHDQENPLTREIEALRREVARLNALSFVRIHNSVPRLLGYSLMRGMAFGLGTVLGASVLISFLVWSLSQVEFIPIIGEWASQIITAMQEYRDGGGGGR
ncbi:MAG: DUF5665 domain-containing protein [Pseudomonadota bacterium]